MAVNDSASRLFELMSSRDSSFTKYLTPGLPMSEIERLVASVDIHLPEEVVAFYNRYNLPRGYAYHPDQPTFYGIYWFLGLEDAVDELLNSRRELWAEFFPAKDYPASVGWFPLLQEDANLYVLDTANSVGGRCPVLGFSEYDEPSAEFESLESFFETLYAWVWEGALPVKKGHVAGAYEGNQQHVAAIASRINPSVDYWKKFVT